MFFGFLIRCGALRRTGSPETSVGEGYNNVRAPARHFFFMLLSVHIPFNRIRSRRIGFLRIELRSSERA